MNVLRFQTRMQVLVVAAVLAPLLAAPAGAQQSRSVSEWVHGGRGVRVEVLGRVEFTPDDRDVAHISPGGRVLIEERRRGGPVFRVVYTPSRTDGVERTISIDGRRSDSGAAAAWLAAILPEVIRETGIGAEARVGRIVAERGVEAALREVEQLRNDGVRRIYFVHLLRHPGLGSDGVARVLRSVARAIASDGDKASLLRDVAATIDLDDGHVGAAYFHAVGTIGSDGDRAGVLRALLTDRQRGIPARVAWLRTARTLASDGDKAMVLTGFARAHPLHDGAVRVSFMDAAVSIASPGDLHHVLRAVIGAEANDERVVVDALRAARAIRSDGDLARLLVAVPRRLLDRPAVRRAFEETASGIRSDGDRTVAFSHLLRG